MVRLTFGGNFCDIAQCSEVPGGSFCEDGACSQKKVWERLKAYEDTGLEPEAVETVKLALAAKHMVDLETLNNTPISRLVELSEADKDGRVVVLPCKVGDKLYRVFAGEIFEQEVGIMKYFAIQERWDIETYPFFPCVESSIGKTVFLSREEAEKALQEMEGKKDGV